MRRFALLARLVVFVAATLGMEDLLAFTLFIQGGEFFGPGDTGIHPIPHAQVRNLQLTGPLSGVVPFFSNGSESPNLIAETLLKGCEGATGLASNGSPVNENIDTGLFLNLVDPGTGEAAKMMVVALQQETMSPDQKGNLVFNPNVVADPGSPDLMVAFQVKFTTGALTVPLSTRTQRGLPGGHDNAGTLPAGTVLIGRLGDFDQNGFLDGTLVQAQNTPADLVVARGDPIAQIRPFTSDVPIDPLTASVLTLSGIVRNFPLPLGISVRFKQVPAAVDLLSDIVQRIDAAGGNLQRGAHAPGLSSQQRAKLERLNDQLREARSQFTSVREKIENPFDEENERHGEHGGRLTAAFQRIERAVTTLLAMGGA